MSTFLCPRCLKTVEIDPSDPRHEIVAVYCLHQNAHIGGGSEPVEMTLVPVPADERLEPIAATR